MSISNLSSSVAPEHVETPLLKDVVDGCGDYKGNPVYRHNSGGWRSASFIIGLEVAERFAFLGIFSNLITYLTGPLGQSMATAAENVNLWSGTASLLPLLGAFVADSFLGRYSTIVLASLIYILGLGMMTLSTTLPSSDCTESGRISCSSDTLQVILFFFALYLVAVGQGGHKPCVQAFGADQFDGQDPEECRAKSSFFNWWYFFSNSGILVSNLVLVYIQDNLSWSLGFGIPCFMMLCALIIFSLASKRYRYGTVKREEKNAFSRIGRVFFAAIRNRRIAFAVACKEEGEEEDYGIPPHPSYEQFKFLNKALLRAANGSKEEGTVCTVSEVEETKAVLRLIPIWTSCLAYAILFALCSTFFVKEAATMDRRISPAGFEIPAASLLTFCTTASLLFITIYDRLFVALSRALTRKPSGITVLQRIGIGMFLSTVSTAFAALVEIKRLKIAQEYGLIDEPNVTVPMSFWWLVPIYILYGVADVFTMVGLQELFYDQVPSDLRSAGLSLYLSIFGVGSLLSSLLVSTIEKVTAGDGRYSWFDNNLNRAHLDYFYWILAVLSAVQLVLYLYYAKSYIYFRSGRI